MVVVANSKRIHKLTIGVLKVIPMLLALTTLLNQILSYFGIDLEILGYIGGISLFPMIFLYLASYCFCFCSYHRMFLHYVVICDIITIVDYYIGIPVSNISLFLINLIVAGIFLFLILYLHQKHVKCNKRTIVKNNR
jgi:hypothetical protein